MVRHSSEEVQVSWACIRAADEVRSVHISGTPDSLTERRKYRYECYGCGDRLIAHKRTQKADSFVHEAAPDCPLTSEDGSKAFHLNAVLYLKHFLDEAVARAAPLTVATLCPRCVESHARNVSRLPAPLVTLQQGDRVVMRERGVGTQHPDIRILRGSRTLLVLDVFSQQPCMDEIWAQRDAFEAPVVEVNAHDILGREDGGDGERWTSERPLLAYRTRRLDIPECKATHTARPMPVSAPPFSAVPPVQLSWPSVSVPPFREALAVQPSEAFVPKIVAPSASRLPPAPRPRLPGCMMEFHLNFFVGGRWRRAFYGLMWVVGSSGNHGELRALDSNAPVPVPGRLLQRYPAGLSGELLKATARADVMKLQERFRREQGGYDFKLEEFILTAG